MAEPFARTLERGSRYALIGFTLLVVLTVVKVDARGRERYAVAENALLREDREEAAAAFEDAARSYLPGSPLVARALQRLEIMARAAELRGELETAVGLHEAIRRAVLSTRHVVQPHRARLAHAEAEIVRLRAASARAEQLPVPPDLVARPRDPSPAGSLLLVLGLVLFVAGGVLLTTPRARANPLARRLAWTLAVGGLALWTSLAALLD